MAGGQGRPRVLEAGSPLDPVHAVNREGPGRDPAQRPAPGAVLAPPCRTGFPQPSASDRGTPSSACRESAPRAASPL